MNIKMHTALILWVHEDFQGPLNGLCSLNDEPLWFRRCGEIKIPHVIASVPELPKVAVPEGSVPEEPESSVSEEPEGSDSEFSSMSDDLPQDADTIAESKYTYDLVRLDADTLMMVSDNHLAYCEATHTPVYHGDVFTPSKKDVALQGAPEDLKPFVNEKGFIEAKFSGMLKVSQYQHKFSSAAITGEVVATISQDDFQNFSVPHTLMH